MNPAVKLILLLLALPILIGIFIVVIPLLIFLLALSLFLPSFRIFHVFQTPRGSGFQRAEPHRETADDDVVEAEYTVVDSTETSDSRSPSDRQLKQ